MMKTLLALAVASLVSFSASAEFSVLGDKNDVPVKKGVFESNKRTAKLDLSFGNYAGTSDETDYDAVTVGFSDKFSSVSNYGYEAEIKYGHTEMSKRDIHYGEASFGLTYERAIANNLSVYSSIGAYYATYHLEDMVMYENNSAYGKIGLNGQFSEDFSGSMGYKYKEKEDGLLKSQHSFNVSLDYKVAKNCSIFVKTELSSDVNYVSFGASYRF